MEVLLGLPLTLRHISRPGNAQLFDNVLSNSTVMVRYLVDRFSINVNESSQDCWDSWHFGVSWKLLHGLLKMIFNENLLCQLSWGNYHERLYKLLPEIPLSVWQTVKAKWNTFVLRNTGYHKTSMQRLILIWNLNYGNNWNEVLARTTLSFISLAFIW